jgi:hypothetical protein
MQVVQVRVIRSAPWTITVTVIVVGYTVNIFLDRQSTRVNAKLLHYHH